MHWLYGQVDTVFVNSEQYRKCWIDRGFAPEKLKILPRGLDTDLFNPARRDLSFWPGAGANGTEVRLLYVGRISREKDLDVLAAAYHKVRAAGQSVKLYLVGLGPYSEALAAMLPDAVFLGYLTGEPLARAYASADVFVFPSTTDTFGNVIIEAQASGLPVIVSDLGGPKELVEDRVNGLVTKAHDAEDVARAITLLAGDNMLRTRMGEKARQSVLDRSWPDAFQKFWHTTDL
jgi:glycosyltransferase involved in cell wall biosynthesis